MFWGLWSEYQMIRRTEICTFRGTLCVLGRKEARAPLSTVRDATWPAPFSPALLQLLPQVSTRVSWAPTLRRRLLIRPLACASARDRGVCAGALAVYRGHGAVRINSGATMAASGWPFPKRGV